MHHPSLLLLFSCSAVFDSLQPMDCSTSCFPVFHYLLNLLKLMSIESVCLLILCHPLLFLPSIFPASGFFPLSKLFASGIILCTGHLAVNKKDTASLHILILHHKISTTLSQEFLLFWLLLLNNTLPLKLSWPFYFVDHGLRKIWIGNCCLWSLMKS